MPTPERGPAFIRSTHDMAVGLQGVFDAAGQVNVLGSYVPGFICTVESFEYIPGVTGAGAGATQTFNLRKGGIAGTILATITVTLATHVLGGAGIKAAVSAANDALARLVDTDTLTIEKAAAGTVFTTAQGTFRIRFRQRLQGRI